MTEPHFVSQWIPENSGEGEGRTSHGMMPAHVTHLSLVDLAIEGKPWMKSWRGFPDPSDSMTLTEGHLFGM